MSRVTSKSRYVVSDHDLVMALELYIPSIRSLERSLSPYKTSMEAWDTSVVSKFDKAFKRGFKKQTEIITSLFVKSSLQRIKAAKLQPEVISTEFDFYTVLEAVWTISMTHKTAIDCFNDYNLAYDTLVPRLAGRLANSKELDNLHRGYGSFNQSIKKLGIALEKIHTELEALGKGKGSPLQAIELTKDAIFKVSEVKHCLMNLKDAHQKGVETARGY